MTERSITISSQSRNLIHMACWAAIILLTLAILPFLIDLSVRLAGKLPGLFPDSSCLWEASLWS